MRVENCPICNSADQNNFIDCVDYTVSRETFSIVVCGHCKFKFTNPRPEDDKLGAYYESKDYISHSNAKSGLINSLYQFVRSYTMLKKLQLINRLNQLNKSKQILDIGCGTGEFLNTCSKAGWNAIGIEPGETAANYAKTNYNLTVLPESAFPQLNEKYFDVVTMWHVLEHVPYLNERIVEIKRVLKNDGKLIIAVPNCNSYDALFYKEFWAAYDVPRHLYHFTPNDIRQLCAKHNLSLLSILPMRFDSFYVSLLSEKYKNGKPRIIPALWRGFRSNVNAIKSGEHFSSQIYIIKNNSETVK